MEGRIASWELPNGCDVPVTLSEVAGLFLGAPEWPEWLGREAISARIVSGSSRLAAIVSRIFRVLAESIGMPVQTADVRYQPTEATDIPWFFPLMRI
jgi:hypothetical protein